MKTFSLYLTIFLAGTMIFTAECESRSRSRGGNVTVTPGRQNYSFLKEHETFKSMIPTLYPVKGVRRGEVDRLNTIFTEPAGMKIKFHNGSEQTISAEVKKRKKMVPQFFAFQEGVYPFSIYKDRKSGNKFSGAMVVFNTTPEISLATFGASDETRLFDPTMLEKAESGILANYSITFDENEVIVYWLGNRRIPFSGGEPNVEMDFSVTKEIEEVTINRTKQRDLVSVILNVYGVRERVRGYDGRYVIDPVTGKYKTKADTAIYKLEMLHSDGKRYSGYIKHLKDNAFTAFMRIPCEIPEELFIAANKGTISKFTVTSGGDDEGVAEIIFGLAK